MQISNHQSSLNLYTARAEPSRLVIYGKYDGEKNPPNLIEQVKRHTGSEEEYRKNTEKEHRATAFNRAYTLKGVLRKLDAGASKAITACGLSPIYNQEIEIEIGENGTASVKGVKTCKNPNCPVCAERRSRFSRDLIYLAMLNAQRDFEGAYFLTLTISHGIEDNLKESLEKLNKAAKLLRGRKVYLDLLNGTSSNRITSHEITHSFENGWHPHIHEVLFTSRLSSAKFDMVRDELARTWRECCKKVGLSTSIKYGLNLMPVKTKKADNTLNFAKYITTSVFFGNTIDHSFSNEIALSGGKKGREQNKSIMEYLDELHLLKDAVEVEDLKRKKRIESVVADFYRSTKGLNFLNFGRGLKARLGVKEYENDWSALIENLKDIGAYDVLYPPKEEQDEEETPEYGKREVGTRFILPDYVYQSVFRKRLVHELLSVVENGKIPNEEIEQIIKVFGIARFETVHRDEFALYLRRCFSECRYIDICEFMERRGYINHQGVFFDCIKNVNIWNAEKPH